MPKDIEDDNEEYKWGERNPQNEAEEHKKSEVKNKEEVITDEELVHKVQEIFYTDDSLAQKFQSFINKRASMVDLNVNDQKEEFKVEYTEAFQEYKDLFEKEMEGYIVGTLKCSIQRFYTALQNKTDEHEDSNEAIFAQILLSVTEFDVFMTMMREEAISLKSSSQQHK